MAWGWLVTCIHNFSCQLFALVFFCGSKLSFCVISLYLLVKKIVTFGAFFNYLQQYTSKRTCKAWSPFYLYTLCTAIAMQFANFLQVVEVQNSSHMCNSGCSSADGRYQRLRTAWRKQDSSPSTFGSGRCQTHSQVETPRNTMPTEMWSTKNRSVSTKETLGTPTSLELQTSSSRMVHSAFCYANVMEPVFSLSINVVWTLTLLSYFFPFSFQNELLLHIRMYTTTTTT